MSMHSSGLPLRALTPALALLSLMLPFCLLNCIFKSRAITRVHSHDRPYGLCRALVVPQGQVDQSSGSAACAAPGDGPSQCSCSPDPSLHQTQGTSRERAPRLEPKFGALAIGCSSRGGVSSRWNGEGQERSPRTQDSTGSS